MVFEQLDILEQQTRLAGNDFNPILRLDGIACGAQNAPILGVAVALRM
jgi:hypothetical protein